MKLALGTAQFGLAYGIASPQPQIAYAESKAIVDYAAGQGITVLDTAMGYGDSEARLGEIGVDAWKVISKLPEVPVGEDAETWIINAVKSSLDKLKVASLYGLLLHRPVQLLGDRGQDWWRKQASRFTNRPSLREFSPSATLTWSSRRSAFWIDASSHQAGLTGWQIAAWRYTPVRFFCKGFS
jgi:aryl-alcohol dehydrogenase-like predicted oxidoreductase